MKLSFDPEELRTCMSLWREVTDMRMPMQDQFKIHLMSKRKSILTGFVRQADAWEMLLRMCKPDAPDVAEFERLVAEVKAFSAWAKNGVEAMEAVLMQEREDDELDRMLHDPKMGSAIRKLFDRKPGDPPQRG